MRVKNAFRTFTVLIMMGAGMGCRLSDDSGGASRRIGVEGRLAKSFLSSQGAFGPQWTFLPIVPEDRTQDLALLLLSSGSKAYSGLILSNDRLALLAPWLEEVSLVEPEAYRRDVVQGLRLGSRYVAMPLSVRVPVMVYRKDLWARYGLDPPATPMALERAAGVLEKASDPTRGRIRTIVPAEELLWSLSWGARGDFSTALYEREKIQALGRIASWEIGGEAYGSRRDFLEARLAGLILYSDQARRLLYDARLESKEDLVGLAPVPSMHGARSLNAGFSLLIMGKADDAADWRTFSSEGFYAWVRAQGWDTPCALQDPRGDPIGKLAAETRFPPFLLPQELRHYARDAVEDVLAGAATAEEALRRACARQEHGG